MATFTDFECEAVRLLVGEHMAENEVEVVLGCASFVSYEHTGSGYLLTVRHEGLPAGRVVCQEPIVTGRSGAVQCGFVAFLEKGELTLECHSWGSVDVPEDFREQRVVIGTAA